MSFASKKIIPKPSSLPRPSSSISPPLNLHFLNNVPTIHQRIETLENNLNALLISNGKIVPLLEMSDYLPLFKKNEEKTKDIQKIMTENGKFLEELRNAYQKFTDELNIFKGEVAVGDEKDLDFKSTDKQIKTTLTHINALTTNWKDLENTLNNLQVSINKKYKEETKSLKQGLDAKFKKNKKEIQKILNETENKINAIFKDYEDNLQKFNFQKNCMDYVKERKSFIEEIDSNLQFILNTNFDSLKINYQKDVGNINREIGMLNTQSKIHRNFYKEKDLLNSMNALSAQSFSMDERILILSKTEIEHNMKFLHDYLNDNIQRISHDLKIWEEQLINVNNEKLEKDLIEKELEFLIERFKDLKNQIQGLKSKTHQEKYTLSFKKEQIEISKKRILLKEQNSDAANFLENNEENLLENCEKAFKNVEKLEDKLKKCEEKVEEEKLRLFKRKI